MGDLIDAYLERISAAPKELYRFIHNYLLTKKDREKWGFPLADPKSVNNVTRTPCTAFDASPDPSEQTCRCGKALSLLDKDWYLDDAGCSYHWGKRSFWGGPDNGLFSCCKGVSEEAGCMHHQYHACNYKPMKGDAFLSPQASHSRQSKSDPPPHACTNVFALDCEMVYTTGGLEVARVSVVAMCGETMYDSFVRPPNRVLDFNTPFSGIRSEDLDGVATTVDEARASVLKLLNKDSILIGHGLENDLVGLHLLHDKLIDTSIVYAHDKGFPYRHSLKTLASRYLKKVIHSDMNGHNSVEDAKTCLALVLHKVEAEMKSKPSPAGDFSKCASPTTPTISCASNGDIFNFISVPKPLGSRLYSNNVLVQNSTVVIIPKIVRFETPVFPTVPRPVLRFPYVPMALCQY